MPFPLSQITPRTTGLPQARYETVASRGGGRERVVKGWGGKGNVKHQHACLDADVDEVGQRVRSPFSFPPGSRCPNYDPASHPAEYADGF